MEERKVVLRMTYSLQNFLNAAPLTEAESTRRIADWGVGCDHEVHFGHCKLEASPDDESIGLEEYIL